MALTGRDQAGFVLPMAVACLVLLATMAAAAVFATGQESSATRAQIMDQQAVSYAERSAMLAIEAWPCGSCDSLAVGSVFMESPAAHPPLESTVYTTRLDSALFLVVAEARVTGAGGTRVTRRISIAVRTARDSLGQVRAFPLHPYSWTAVYGM